MTNPYRSIILDRNQQEVLLLMAKQTLAKLHQSQAKYIPTGKEGEGGQWAAERTEATVTESSLLDLIRQLEA